MGHKKVCFVCRKAFSISNDATAVSVTHKCPVCGNTAHVLSQKFKPPKRTDLKQWEMVKFLVDNGFVFHSQLKCISRGSYIKVPYPKSMEEAKEFVATYGRS